MGGLQSYLQERYHCTAMIGFNTENGRGRAAMSRRSAESRRNPQPFQYRERSWEGCNRRRRQRRLVAPAVSIPRTVVGGLQSHVVDVDVVATRRFQYRERSWEGCNVPGQQSRLPCAGCFNTENGRGRAAMTFMASTSSSTAFVSIPRTVVGGLQF